MPPFACKNQQLCMFLMLSTAIAANAALCKGFSFLIGVLPGGLTFALLLGAVRVGIVAELVGAWFERFAKTAHA